MIKGLSELVLIVEDVQAATDFYRQVVGLTPDSPADDDWAWFWAGPSGGSRLALHRGPLLFEEHSPRPPDERWGPTHFALRVDRADLESAVKRVQQHGHAVYGPVHFDWMQATSYYFYDLDANLVEFWSPDPPEGERR